MKRCRNCDMEFAGEPLCELCREPLYRIKPLVWTRIWFTEITWNFDQCKTMGDFDITSSWIGSA